MVDLLRMLSASQFCFAVVLAALYHAQQGESSSHFNNTKEFTGGGEGFRNYTKCGWNCAVIEKDLPKQSDSLYAKTSLIELVVNYKTKVDKKCVNQTSRSSSGFATENFEVWLPAKKKLPSFANGIKSVSNIDMISGSISRFKGKIKVVCNLKPTRTAAPSPTDVRVELQKSIEAMDFKIIVKKPEGRLWSEISLTGMKIVCYLALYLYFPAFFCLFSPTIVTENGVRYIAIKGASPVSFRALIGNNLFANDCTTWRDKARMLISRFVVLPLFVLPSVTIVLLYLPSYPVLFGLHFTHPFVITALACLIIWAVYDSLLLPDVSHEAQACKFCRDVQKHLTCVDILPRRILSHLRMLVQILVYCWGWFIRRLVRYFKKIINCSLNGSTVWVIRIPLFIILVSTVPAVIIVLLAILLIFLCTYIFVTSPVSLILSHLEIYKLTVNGGSLLNRLLQKAKAAGSISVALLAVFGGAATASTATLGILFTLLLALTIILLFPEESLPLVACFVLVFYYLFSSYSSFTDKYQDLSVTLFKCYKTSQQELCTEPVQEVTPNSDNNSNMQVLKIPEKLFDMACEELMPIKEAVCILVLKVTLILCFVFVVFLLTITLDVGASPLTKALVTFLTGTFPKIIAIFFNGEKQRNFEAIIIEEKAHKIVQEYLNRNQRANQGEDNGDANTNGVILNPGNEENVDLLIFESSV